MGNDSAKDKTSEKDLEQAKKKLVTKARKEGKIDQREIFTIIPDTPENIDALEAFYSELADENIEVIEATEPNTDDFSAEWVPDDEEEVKLDEPIYLDDVSDDSVRLYLREIGKIPLLKPDEELALAYKVKTGSKKAKDKMAEANMRLVVSIAKRYVGRGQIGRAHV